MANHRSRIPSALWLLALLLATAGLSTLDIKLSDRPGEAWLAAFEEVGLLRTPRDGPEPDEDTPGLLLRVICRESSGDERVFTVGRPVDEDRRQEEVVAAVRALFELHLTGSVSVDVIAPGIGASPLPETTPAEVVRTEWE